MGPCLDVENFNLIYQVDRQFFFSMRGRKMYSWLMQKLKQVHCPHEIIEPLWDYAVTVVLFMWLAWTDWTKISKAMTGSSIYINA